MTGVPESSNLEAALAYLERGWLLFPMNAAKRPLTAHGRTDASKDPTQIRQWAAQWPSALFALATGAENGVVAVDIDIRDNVDGRDALDGLGIGLHPETPTAHSPSGGYHLLFKHPGGHVKSVAGKLGPGLDVRGDGGSICLPPGPGRYWDPALNLETVPLAEFPDWARIPEPIVVPSQTSRPSIQAVSRYGECALDSAVAAIVSAPVGTQETTLNQQAWSIGNLVGGNELPIHVAEASLAWAAQRMASHDRRHPWRPQDLQRKIRDAIVAGMRQPRSAAHGR